MTARERSAWSVWSAWRRRLVFPTAALAAASFIAVLAIQTAPRVPDTSEALTAADRASSTDDAESLPHLHGTDAATDAAHGDAHGDTHTHADTVVGGAHVHAVVAGTAPGMPDGHDHDHSDPGHSGGGTTTPTGPIVSVDDPRLSPAQQQAARTLLVSSRATISSLPDTRALTAAGYVSAGDNSGGMSHWVKDEFTHDGREVDARRIESFMVQNSTGRTVGAMYVLEPGRTMADVPAIAGELTTWHIHDPICFSTAQIWRFVSFASNGKCPAGSFVRIVPPMMHVWLEDQACGPFVGTEGHGSTDCASHSH